ncbi:MULTISPECIES: patatin-like phospholipase family protein [Pseudovibrio]|uniref:patatin-like phospholipase family protein n=1 Tax=Stappiaceae TaxID=2821832 RepID=UPI0023662376|nr:MULTISPECIES: patatin-like phospholipase family protein [Pseudovibrio]MDD7911988.1 patatin-like phospholipase family protein [Pseudovibrio exalbescens]MDX5595483.1 patatin-like phospholipase family protein [Pseudovibrio sp. SPO723]
MSEEGNTDQSEREPLLVDLALQGGGSHGAFAWGVLDRLLDYPWLKVEAISGTSAGAMNAAVFAYGMTEGGPEGARKALETFWRSVSQAARFSPFQRTPLDWMMGNWTLDYSPAYIMADTMARFVSPYAFGPFASETNPLRRILEETIDFRVLAEGPIKLFITATNVRTGRGRVFRRDEVTPDVLLASACLPTLYQPVVIDGEAYWDGGYSGNPTIAPLVRECESFDTFLVQINPVNRPDVPITARDILNRVNEVSFNATLLKELKMVALMRKVADPGNSEGRLWGEMRLHRISSEAMVELSASSKLNAEWAFLKMLKQEGQRAADNFARDHGKDVGVRSSFDFDALLEGV